MRRLPLALALILAGAFTLHAYTFEAYNGNVTFDHRLHREKLQLKCSECHDGPPRHFELDKAGAHKLCIGCHKKLAKGPAAHCADCHKTS